MAVRAWPPRELGVRNEELGVVAQFRGLLSDRLVCAKADDTPALQIDVAFHTDYTMMCYIYAIGKIYRRKEDFYEESIYLIIRNCYAYSFLCECKCRRGKSRN